MNKEMLLKLLALVEICLHSATKENCPEGYYSAVLDKKFQASELFLMLGILSSEIDEG